MPLVVPGINNNAAGTESNSAESWLNKLAGKQLGDSHDATVCARL